jgi:PAS domain S-box-containing protein
MKPLGADAYRLLIEGIVDYAIFVVDPAGHILTWSRGAERIKGYREDEIIGKHFSIFYTPEDVASGLPARELAEAREHGRTEDEGWRVRKDGSRFWANVVISALRNDKGEIHGFAKITRDLTERRAAEENARRLAEERAARAAAEASAGRLRLLAESSRLFINAQLDVQGTYQAIARQCTDIIGEGCSITLAAGDQLVEVVAFEHRDPEAVRLARETFFQGRIDARRSLVGEVIRTGQPSLLTIPDVSELLQRSAPAAKRFIEKYPTHCFLAVPLRVRGGVIGALTMLRHDAQRPYTEDDKALLSDLADRASFAVENASLFASQVSLRRIAEQAADRWARLQATTSALARALTRQEVGDIALREGLGNFSALAGLVYLLDDRREQLRLIASMHASEARRALFTTVPLTTELPVTAAVRSGEPVFLESRDELRKRYPVLRDVDMGGTQATITLPLLGDEGAAGAITLTFADPRTFTPEDRGFALAIAQQCSQALQRTLLIEREREAAARNALLAEASEIFAQTLDPDVIFQRLAEVCVPRISDWCAIESVEEGGGRHLAAVAHADPDKVRWARELNEKYPPDPDAPRGVPYVARTGKPELYSEIPEQILREGARDAEHLDIIMKLGLRSVIIVPIAAHGEVLGVMTLIWSETPKSYADSDLRFVMDIAHRAGLAVENARLYKRLQVAVQIRDDFVAVAGHELKTPLAALMMQLQLLDRVMARDGDLTRVRERVEKLSRSAERLDLLINQMLDVSRITSARLRVEPEPMDLCELVREVIERFSDAAARAHSRIVLTGESRIGGTWDRLRLEQVITNLLSNAIKYGAGKPVEIDVRVEDGEAVLQVTDHGIGIEAEQQKRIFERFERAVSSRDFGGFGLGLWITRQIVEASGGRIAVESQPGNGACFTVRLPLSAERTLGIQ